MDERSKCDICVYNKLRSKGGVCKGLCMPVFRMKRSFGLEFIGFVSEEARRVGVKKAMSVKGEREIKKGDIRYGMEIWRVVEIVWDVPEDCDLRA